jgi:hypothetical protein
MKVGGQRHDPAALPRRPLYRKLGGPQGRSGRVRKILPLPGFDPRTVQTVASLYTAWGIRAHYIYPTLYGLVLDGVGGWGGGLSP